MIIYLTHFLVNENYVQGIFREENFKISAIILLIYNIHEVLYILLY